MDRKLKLKRGWFGDTVSYVYLTILAIIAMFPMVWILLTSVKGKGEMMGDPTAFLPKSLTLDNYRTVIQQLGFGGNVVNSIIVAMSTTLIAILISALGAYGVVRFFPKFGKLMTRVLITTYMFPPILLAVPYAIWLLVGFFQTVPLEIEEAARVDGANKLQVFGKVVLPIVAPGLVAVAIYTFINAWNEFLYSLILMNSSDKMTVAVALKSLEGQEVMDWGVMMAASAMVVIPSVIFFMLIQKKIAGGLASGSIK